MYSATVLRTVLYGEIIWGADNVYYKCVYISAVFKLKISSLLKGDVVMQMPKK